MVNTTNAVDITINTGDSLVVGFELLFKEMTDNTIKVIEKFNKDTEGIGDNTGFPVTILRTLLFVLVLARVRCHKFLVFRIQEEQ